MLNEPLIDLETLPEWRKRRDEAERQSNMPDTNMPDAKRARVESAEKGNTWLSFFGGKG